MVSSNQPFA